MKEPISSVDQALQSIRDGWTSNGPFLDDLKERITSPGGVPLVPFVGAGFSIPMGLPSWGAFLAEKAAECGKSGEAASLMSEGKYGEAAEIVECGLGEAIFNRRVAHT